MQVRDTVRRRNFLGLSLLAAVGMMLTGCPKGGDTTTSGSGSSKASGDSWVIFEVYEAGTGNPLEATVWPKGNDEEFDTIVQGQAGSAVRFDGIGRREDGYALPFRPGLNATLMVWSVGHEMQAIDIRKLKKGENMVSVELKRTEVEDDAVPERIRLQVLESLPTEGVKTGS